MSAVKARPKVQASPAPRLPNQASNSADRSIDRRPQNSSRSQQRRRQRERTREQQFRVQSINYDVPYPHENKERPRRIRKVYRRKKVLRKWVFPALFFVPLGMIWVEYYIGKLIDLDDIRDVYQDQLVDPWDLLEQDFNASRIRERGSIPSLPKLAYAPRTQCPPGQRRMINVHNPVSPSGGRRRIPMIVHQQSKTRCLTMKVDAATTKWAMKRVCVPSKVGIFNPCFSSNSLNHQILTSLLVLIFVSGSGVTICTMRIPGVDCLMNIAAVVYKHASFHF